MISKWNGIRYTWLKFWPSDHFKNWYKCDKSNWNIEKWLLIDNMENSRNTNMNRETVRLIFTKDLNTKKVRYWKISAANKKSKYLLRNFSKIIRRTWCLVIHFHILIVIQFQHYKHYIFSSYNGKYIITDYSITNYHSLDFSIIL